MVGIQGRIRSGSGFDSRRTSRLGVRGRCPARALLLAARRSSFQRAEAQAGEGRNNSAGARPFGVRKYQGHTSRVSSLKREKNAVWFFGEEMWDLILG